MRIDGVNTGNVHTSQSHHVTDCVHDHQHSKDSVGGMDALSFSAAKTEVSPQVAKKMQENTGGFSLTEGFKRFLSQGKRLFHRLWNGPESMSGADSQQAPAENMSVVNPQQAPAESKAGADDLWQRFKLKVYTATGYLAKRFGRGTALQTNIKKEQGGRGEEFQRREQLKKEPEEIESISADKSYLMDSYDKTGKYVKLGQENGRKLN